MGKSKKTKSTKVTKRSGHAKPADAAAANDDLIKLTKKTKANKEPRISLLDHAMAALKKQDKAMSCKEIIDVVLAEGKWKSGGKTPAATLYSAIIREIANKGKESRFKKIERGQFVLAK
ncbi:MAG: winged helix-turn-helix domain-containing protein [Phycisphaerales bacterium]|nr:winged helix-turn-helix domain-containing protein [Phycisphaerales bacterium]